MAWVALTLSGCSGTSPGPQDLAGVWKTKSGATLVISPGGRLELNHIPGEYFNFDTHGSVSGAGRWRAVYAPGQSRFADEWWELRFDLDPNNAFPHGIEEQVYYSVRTVLDPPSIMFWPNAEPDGTTQEFIRQ